MRAGRSRWRRLCGHEFAAHGRRLHRHLYPWARLGCERAQTRVSGDPSRALWRECIVPKVVAKFVVELDGVHAIEVSLREGLT